MSNVLKHYTLSNGIQIPSIGFGTFQVEEGPGAVDAVKEAIQAGYRHIDTAQGYGNEQGVGRAVKASGVAREEIYITSKLTNQIRGYEETKKAIDHSLKLLDTDYMDLFLLHWPVPSAFKNDWAKQNAESWRAMEEAVDAGKIRSLGISNFHKKHIDELLKTARIKPVVNQIRLCPGDTQDEVVKDSRAAGMILEAYSPFGTGKLFDVDALNDLAKKHGKTPAQIAIRWSLQMGFLPLPKSVTPTRIKENIQVFDFELTENDMAAINALDGVIGYSQDPDNISW
ncbi:MAG TPA: aldo/keto reductase [Clostridiales bacterium]|nr:aldo/keto reductase [Clostridiales bacterium]